jgi:hypothetical protein
MGASLPAPEEVELQALELESVLESELESVLE